MRASNNKGVKNTLSKDRGTFKSGDRFSTTKTQERQSRSSATNRNSEKKETVPACGSASASGVSCSSVGGKQSRNKTVSRSGNDNLKRSPVRPVERSKSGLTLGFRKALKSQTSVRPSNVCEKANETKKFSGSNFAAGDRSQERTTSRNEASHPSIYDQDKVLSSGRSCKSKTDNNVSVRSSGQPSNMRGRFGISLSFRRGSKAHPGCNSRSARSDQSRLSSESEKVLFELEKELQRERQDNEQKSYDIDVLTKDIAELRVANNSLKSEVMALQANMTASNNPSDLFDRVLSPISARTGKSTPMILEETADDYSLFDQSHNVACLQDQLSKMQEHNKSTTEELQATIEELQDLRVKANTLREENHSLVCDQRILCESLCQQSERASQYEEQMDRLKVLLKSTDLDENEYQRKLGEILQSFDIEREQIMNDFELLKRSHADVEMELEATKLESQRLREQRDRWKAKYEKLKCIQSGYNMRLSLINMPNKENKVPLRPCESNQALSSDQRVDDLKMLNSKLEAEVRRLNTLVKTLHQKSEAKPNEAQLDLLCCEKDALICDISEMRSSFEEERKSWEGFKADLLIAVRVADTYRLEAENEAKHFSTENEMLHKEVTRLRKDLERLRRSGLGLLNTSIGPSSSSVKAIVQSLESRIRGYGSSAARETGKPPSASDTLDRAKHFRSRTALDKLRPPRSRQRTTLGNAEDSDDVESNPHCGKLSASGQADARDSISSVQSASDQRDPLLELVRQSGGSKRNTLLRWCQDRTKHYSGVEISNFSSSWADGLAFCALISSYRPDVVPFTDMESRERRKNVGLFFCACDRLGIDRSSLSEEDIVASERPAWEKVMRLVTVVFYHFEGNPCGRADALDHPGGLGLRTTCV